MRDTLNSPLMAEHQKYAEGYPGVGGMMNVQDVTLLTHMKIYRFATAGTPSEHLCTAAWWFSYSPYQALRQASGNHAPLRDVARERLAVPPEWGNAMDLLVCARMVQPLSAWSGIPRTARTKDVDTQAYGRPWTPDRSITQLYVPGLNPRRPDGTIGEAIDWSQAVFLDAATLLVSGA